MANNLNEEILIDDFVKIALIAGQSISADDIDYEYLLAPHSRPRSLPQGKMAVYIFTCGETCLKVGKVGPSSAARFTSQHYLPNVAQSTLAGSILSHVALPRKGIDALLDDELLQSWARLSESSVSDWMLAHTTRHHFFLDADQPPALLSLLEAFIQCRLSPIFEG